MIRFAVDYALAKRRRDAFLRLHPDGNIQEKRTHVGYFRKRDIYDCGVPRCWVCHSDKVFKLPNRQELQIRECEKEWQSEYLILL